MYNFFCQKCETECDVEIDGHDAFTWCMECDDYPKGFNDQEFIVNYWASIGDDFIDRLKDID